MARFSSWRRGRVLVPAMIVIVMALAVGGYLFQPWKAVVDTSVDEAAPVPPAASQPSSTAATRESESAASPGAAASAVPTAPTAPRSQVLRQGTFVSQEHATSGQVSVLALADGRRILRIEGLDTSDGPDVKVWLSDAAVTPGTDGASTFDDGAYVDLGKLRGNQGNLNYEIPAAANLQDLTSVSLWCDRFDVSFGAAELVQV